MSRSLNSAAIKKSSRTFKSPAKGKPSIEGSGRCNFSNIVLLMPEAYRVAVEEQTGVPKINLLKYVEKSGCGTEYRVHVTVQLQPCFCFTERNDRPDYLLLKPREMICELEQAGLWRCKAISFRLGAGFREVGVRLYTSPAEIVKAGNAAEAFPITFDCSLAAFDNFKNCLLKGLEVGQILMELEQESNEAQKLIKYQAVPVKLNQLMKKINQWL